MNLVIEMMAGAPVWLSWLSFRLWLRSWSHGLWVRVPHQALCWQFSDWSLLWILCLPLSLLFPCSCSVSVFSCLSKINIKKNFNNKKKKLYTVLTTMVLKSIVSITSKLSIQKKKKKEASKVKQYFVKNWWMPCRQRIGITATWAPDSTPTVRTPGPIWCLHSTSHSKCPKAKLLCPLFSTSSQQSPKSWTLLVRWAWESTGH